VSLFEIIDFYKKIIGLRVVFALFLVLIAAILEAIGLIFLIPFFKTIFVESIEVDENVYALNLFGDLNFSQDELILLIIFIFVLKAVFLRISYKYIATLRGEIINSLRERVLQGVCHTTFDFYTSNGNGKWASLFSDLTDRVAQNFQFFVYSLASLVFALLLIAFLIYISTSLAIIFLAFSVIGFFAITALDFKIRKSSQIHASQRVKASNRIHDLLINYKYLKGSARMRMDFILDRVSLRKLTDSQVKIWDLNALGKVIKEPLSILFIFSTFFLYTNFFDEENTFFILYLVYVYRITSTISTSHHYWNSALEHVGSVQEVNSFLLKTESNYENYREQNIDSFENIAFKGVSFKYPHSSEYIFKDVNLNISKGSFVAFYSKSGSGKTTFTDLILGLYPPISGEILLNETDLSLLNISNWRNKVGYVSQDPAIFRASLVDNLTFFNKTYDIQKMQEFLKEIGMQDMEIVEKVNDDLDGDEIKLSGGQKQRIALARELISNREVLIIDEVTSSLDIDSESLVFELLNKIKGKHTIIMITHKKEMLELADYVYTIKNKKIERY